MPEPLISICIPAYRRVAYLERLLHSIARQDHAPFEVVLTDDSPDDSVRELAGRFQDKLPLRYIKNPVALGTPENWNEGIRQARGTWIKVMHDDDWFATDTALGVFGRAIVAHPEATFFFSAYQNVYEENGVIEPIWLGPAGRRRLERSPWYLLGANYIGNPSCTLFRKQEGLLFDPAFKWVVDFEFYIRYLDAFPRYRYLDEVLVNVGINATQVTNYTFGVTTVQVPENHLLLEKNGREHLKNLVVYDYFWRLYRNLGIRETADIATAGYTAPLPQALPSMIRWQSRIPRAVLRFGPASKTLMFLHYLTHL
ncbi:glycosyltransferase family 2 protein [Dinghuibacter silviterrae]|uniref:Glycosyl transferase family 2 n=1 Tax=Dinghuibacter silviterrae TaxID=1539049 RepID=A0A4R8DG81_9BACT|nr:glycosyltransferase [Dinghuibacter silviterrae]TDW96641.1 glycosyl transferase family 2 [Dinghuibacter silviterrae]